MLVVAHTRFIGDAERERRVPAFFRLGTHGGPATHLPNCPYTAAGQVRRLLAAGLAVEVALRPFTAYSDANQLAIPMHPSR